MNEISRTNESIIQLHVGEKVQRGFEYHTREEDHAQQSTGQWRNDLFRGHDRIGACPSKSHDLFVIVSKILRLKKECNSHDAAPSSPCLEVGSYAREARSSHRAIQAPIHPRSECGATNSGQA